MRLAVRQVIWDLQEGGAALAHHALAERSDSWLEKSRARERNTGTKKTKRTQSQTITAPLSPSTCPLVCVPGRLQSVGQRVWFYSARGGRSVP